MKTAAHQIKDWSNMYGNPPRLSEGETAAVSLLTAIFLVMAILQAASFSDFQDALGSLGLASPATWAVIIIIAEVWAAIGLFKVRLHGLMRFFGGVFAVLATGFWFVESLQVLSNSETGTVVNMGFFGKYLSQQPGWWTMIEASLLLFWSLYALSISKK